MNKIRDLKPEGRDDVIVYGYEEVALKLPVLKFRLTSFWSKINGQDQYYWWEYGKPSPHRHNLIKFRR